MIVFALMPAAATAAPAAKFVSKLYGYSLVLPGTSSDWSATFAQDRWSTGRIEPDMPDFDTFTSLKTQRAHVIGARRPPSGSTLKKWTAFVISKRPSACLAPRTPLSNSTLSGTRARVLRLSCTDGYVVIGITALHAGRGYFMFVASPTNLPRVSDGRAFDAARRAFRFLGR